MKHQESPRIGDLETGLGRSGLKQLDQRRADQPPWPQPGQLPSPPATCIAARLRRAGNGLALFADRNTDLHIFGFNFPSSWLQVLQPFFVIVLAPLFAWLWIRLGSREPSVPTKFGFGLLFMGLAFVIMLPAGAAVAADNTLRVSVWWLIMWNLFSEFGELCLSPVGLSAITKLSPARIVGLMMGVWFLSLAAGNKLSGWMAGLISTMSIQGVLEWMGGTLVVAALAMFVLVKPLRRLMGDVK